MSHLVWLGHERAGPRRDLDVLVLLPRARDDPRPVRDVLGPAHAHALLPGRRRHRGHPAPASAEQRARVLRGHARPRRPVRATCSTRTRSSCSACATSCPLDEDDAARRSASPARCCARPATRGTCARRCPTRSYEDFDFKIPVGTQRRQLRPLRRAHRRDVRVGEDHRAGARRPARGPAHHRGPQGRAAAAPRARHLDGGAHPPLQARDRGLPRAAGRGLLPDRVAARRARLLRALRRLEQARARAHARPVVREPPGAPRRWSRTPTSPT